MTKHKALFLDLDGTIILPDDTIQESTKEAIKQVQQQGIEVFLATGRPIHEIKDIGEELHVYSFIGYNGAYAVHKGNDIFIEPMKPEMIQFFLDLANEQENEIVLYTNDKNVFTALNSQITEGFIKKFHLKQNVHFNSVYINRILGVTLLNLRKNEPALYEEYGNIHLSPVNVDGFRDHAFDVIRDNINKGFAVQQVLDKLDISKEQAIAFGDGINDKEMLASVGDGFAMGNANHSLFEYAKHKTTDVTNSGVFEGLKSLGLVR
ncbi:HAD family hydrolase [Anaerobacillus sp. MEB173]|uniref:HAD family hydrolase n=1 Tax=Anaerobacillus sp. MEB173 TaxID=3383345 RepID=UPI003F8F7E56